MNVIYFFREISSSQQNFFRMLDKKIEDVSVAYDLYEYESC